MYVQVRFIILYLYYFFISHYIPAGINQQPMLNLPVKATAENIAQQKVCGKMNLS